MALHNVPPTLHDKRPKGAPTVLKKNMCRVRRAYFGQLLAVNPFDLKEIFYNYEEEEARFEATCFDKSIVYVPNLNLTEKIEYLEGVTAAPAEIVEHGLMDNFYHKCQVNLYYKMVQLGFIVTNPLGELQEPIKINLSL